ncbi:hypothetical protein BC830DRAFT_624492 [Chytriomyces sp. MP71]|nr:hypothetical protein BC830DRAFT_624492 [Chytriomyces sp. MP71]
MRIRLLLLAAIFLIVVQFADALKHDSAKHNHKSVRKTKAQHNKPAHQLNGSAGKKDLSTNKKQRRKKTIHSVNAARFKTTNKTTTSKTAQASPTKSPAPAPTPKKTPASSASPSAKSASPTSKPAAPPPQSSGRSSKSPPPSTASPPPSNSPSRNPLPPTSSPSPNPSGPVKTKPSTKATKTTPTSTGGGGTGYTGNAPGPSTYLNPSPSPLSQPTVLTSQNGQLSITLTVTANRHSDFVSFNSRQYSYNGITSIPGPTWNVTAGDTITLTLVNALGSNDDLDDILDPTLMNTMHSPNSTNMHTHGMHVDTAQDYVFQHVYPGGSHTYTYTIQADHAPGLHWYHSHKHGTSAMQVMGGLIGAIYVRPTDAAVVASSALQYLNNLQRYTIVAHHFAMTSINSNDDPFTVRTYQYLSDQTGSTLPINAVFTDSTVQDVYMVNGQFQPQLAMTTGVQVVLDIVNAVGDVIIELDIRDTPQASRVSSNCQLVQIASDGVYFQAIRTTGYVAMLPANRATIIIQCKNPGTYYLTNVPDDNLRAKLTDNETRYAQSMMMLVVTGSATSFSSMSGLDLATITRPAYLADTTSATVSSTWQLSVDQDPQGSNGKMWLGIGDNCTIFSSGRGGDAGTTLSPEDNLRCSYLPFPGELSTKGPYRHITHQGAVDELTIIGRGASPHMVHIHVNHMQIIADGFQDDSSRYFYRIGDFKDTVPALVPYVKVRQNVADYSGEIPMHCHFLLHEDLGMMATYYVRPAAQVSSGDCVFPDGTATNGYCAV